MTSRDRFGVFIGDNRLLKELDKTEPNPDNVLIELFIYKDSGLIIDPTSDAISGSTKDSSAGKTHLFPYGKVLIDGTKYKAGDIIKLPNELAYPPEKNPEYEDVQKHNKAFPNDKRALPDEYIGEANIVGFMKKYSFDHRPFKKDSNPNYKVLIPSYIIECKMDKEMMLKI